jgi:hypothetical protein
VTGRIATSVPQSSRSWIGSTLVVLATASFLVALSHPKTSSYRQLVDSVFHNWIAMVVCALALWFARRKAFGPLPSIFRGVSGVLLPVFIILSILGLLTWSPLWDALAPFGVIEKEVRRPAITATIAFGLIGCGFLMLRTFFRWIRRFSRRYEHAGVAVGFGPLYFYFRRRRTS